MQVIPECTPNLGGSMADPYCDNPSYSIINSTTLEQSPSLTLTILLEAWPINSYPFATQLPSGSVLIIAGLMLCWQGCLPAYLFGKGNLDLLLSTSSEHRKF